MFCGDFDGDRDDTLGIKIGSHWRPTEANVTSPITDVAFFYGEPSDQGLVGDWDGNRSDTVAVARQDATDPHRINVFLRNSNTAGRGERVWIIFRRGSGRFTVLAGNWDGSGADGPGIVEPTERGLYWQLRDTNLPENPYSFLGSEANFYYGYDGDRPLVWLA